MQSKEVRKWQDEEALTRYQMIAPLLDKIWMKRKTLMNAYQHQKRLIDEHMVKFVADHKMVSGAE